VRTLIEAININTLFLKIKTGYAYLRY